MTVGCQGFSAGKSAAQQPLGTLALSGASLDFGSVTAGQSKTMTAAASNTGTVSLTVSSASISSKYFSLTAPSLPITLGPGQSVPVTVVFTPNAAGAFSATATIASTASDSSTSISLTGTGVASSQLAVSPTTENFGSITVDSQSNQTITLTNGTGATVNISQVSVSGAGFKMSGITTPLALTASQSTTFTATFSPLTAGSASGTVTITSDAPNPSLSLPLSGTGVTQGAVGSNPTSLDFGTVTVGSKQVMSETVTNTGGSTLTISQVGVSGTGFSVSGISTPATLIAGEEHNFQCDLHTVVSGQRQRQRHCHIDRRQSNFNDSSDGYGDRHNWIADGVSLAHCNWQRSRRNQRIIHGKSDCQWSERYSDGREFK